MFRSGRRLFSIAAILMIVTAGLHTLGFASNVDKFHKDFASVDPPTQDAFWVLAFSMSITFTALGAMNLVAAALDASDRLIRALAWTNFLWLAAVCILSWIQHVAPPLILSAAIEVVIVADLIVKPSSKRKESS